MEMKKINMEKMKFVKTPIRCPGGKSKALDFLIPHVPLHEKYIECFLGGGSMFLRLAQIYPDRDYHINDLFFPTYAFWKTLHEQPMTMLNYILQKKNEYIVDRHEIEVKGTATKSAENGKRLHTWCRQEIESKIKEGDEFHTACLWYILNKTSFSGMAMIGSYAKLAWDQNFTDNCILNLPKVSKIMRGVKSLRITNEDYSTLLTTPTDKDAFIFCDPPYDIKDNLYGNNGDMHRGFDHQKFGEDVIKCNHKWMITYNDNPTLVDRFKAYKQVPWYLQYTMKAAKRIQSDGSTASVKSGKKGKELLVLNY